MCRIRAGILIGICLAAAAAGTYASLRYWERRHAFKPVSVAHHSAPPTAKLSAFQQSLLKELGREVRAGIRYQDGYYAGGEPPPDIGVCTDVVIRSFRAAGVDLRRAVAEDVKNNPRAYQIARPDPNIDHRRCRNLAVFLQRCSKSLPASGPHTDWQPGDVVFWDTHGDGRIDHVAMIAAGRDSAGSPTVIHHWPGLPVSETDGLYRFTVKGHFRWKG